jgi:hypothetical protein
MRRNILDLVTVLGIFAAIAWGSNQRRAYTRADSRLSSVIDEANRTVVQDRLIGTELSLPPLEPYIPGSPQPISEQGKRRLVWILSAAECLGCFNENASWNRVAETPSVDAHLIVVGRVPAEVESHLISLRNTAVWALSADSLDAHMGPILPNIKLLVNEEGVIAMADARSAGQACGWSFNEQVRTLLGGSSGVDIRSD